MEPPSHEDSGSLAERVLGKIARITSTCLIVPAAIILVAWVFVIVAYILARDVARVSWLFVEEFTTYVLVLISFFAFAYAVRRSAHVNVTEIVSRIPQRAQDILMLLTNLLSTIIVAYLGQKGVIWFLQGLETRQISQYPSGVLLWPVYLLVPVGYFAMDLELLLLLYRSAIKVVKGSGGNTNTKGGR